MNTIVANRYYTVRQAAEILDCAPQTVRNYINNGTINAAHTKHRPYGHHPLTIKGIAILNLYNN